MKIESSFREVHHILRGLIISERTVIWITEHIHISSFSRILSKFVHINRLVHALFHTYICIISYIYNFLYKLHQKYIIRLNRRDSEHKRTYRTKRDYLHMIRNIPTAVINFENFKGTTPQDSTLIPRCTLIPRWDECVGIRLRTTVPKDISRIEHVWNVITRWLTIFSLVTNELII